VEDRRAPHVSEGGLGSWVLGLADREPRTSVRGGLGEWRAAGFSPRRTGKRPASVGGGACARQCGEAAGPQPLGASAPMQEKTSTCPTRAPRVSGGRSNIGVRHAPCAVAPQLPLQRSWVVGLGSCGGASAPGKASRQLQLAEKIDMRFFLALPGLKPGARQSHNKRRPKYQTASRERKLPEGAGAELSPTTIAPAGAGTARSACGPPGPVRPAGGTGEPGPAWGRSAPRRPRACRGGSLSR